MFGRIILQDSKVDFTLLELGFFVGSVCPTLKFKRYVCSIWSYQTFPARSQRWRSKDIFKNCMTYYIYKYWYFFLCWGEFHTCSSQNSWVTFSPRPQRSKRYYYTSSRAFKASAEVCKVLYNYGNKIRRPHLSCADRVCVLKRRL